MRAYNNPMKKKIVAVWLSVVVAFCLAVGLCVDALDGEQPVFAQDTTLKIVIDAGHGGIDGGVTGVKTGVKESDLNLILALKLSKRLQEQGFRTALTRKTQDGLYDTTAKGFKKRDMTRRKEIIESESPALVLSLHQNLYPSSSQRGGQVFYLPGDEEDERLASCLQDGLNGLYRDEGVKGRKHMAAEYFILQCGDCPSALIECGFLSNEKDEKLLLSDNFQGRLVEVICRGVTEYLFSVAAEG